MNELEAIEDVLQTIWRWKAEGLTAQMISEQFGRRDPRPNWARIAELMVRQLLEQERVEFRRAA